MGTGNRSAAWLLLVPGLVALLAFASALDGEFVYDDRDLIVQNPWVHELEDLPSAFTRPMWGFRTSAATNYYRPVPLVAYTLLWVAGGGSPQPFHVSSVLLHAVNAILAAGLVLRLSRDRTLAVAAGTLFAVHPLVTEAVAWASCLPELLYAAAVLGFLHVHLTAADGTRRRPWLVAFATGLLLLGLLSKETAIAALPLAFVLEWLRGRGAAAAARGVAVYLIPVAVVFGLRLAVLGGLAPQASGEVGTWDGLLLVPKVLLSYLGFLIAPHGLSAHHVLEPGWAGLRLLLGLCGLVLLAVGARLRPESVFAAALTLLPLLPVLYVPVLGVTPLAERYAYLSVLGFVWVALGAISRLLEPMGSRRRAALALLAGVLVVSAAAAAVRRNRVWHDERVLAEALLREEPRAEPGYLMLAKWFWDRGQPDQAIEVFRRGVKRLPDNATLRSSLVVSLWSQGRLPASEAIPALESLVAARPGDAMLQYNLGEAYLREGRADEADARFVRALAARPACSECLVGRAVAAARRGDQPAAVAFANQALALAPGDIPARLQLGVSLLRVGDAPGALLALKEAARAAPANAEVWNVLGAAHATAGNLAEAGQAWERAVALDPQLEKARLNLERLRARQARDAAGGASRK